MFGMKADPFTGRKVLLTLATQGAGPALAADLVRRGASVVLLDSDGPALARLSDALDGLPTTGAFDLRDPTAPDRIGGWLRSDHADLAGLILNQPDGAAPLPAPLVARLLTRITAPSPLPPLRYAGSDRPAVRRFLDSIRHHPATGFHCGPNIPAGGIRPHRLPLAFRS